MEGAQKKELVPDMHPIQEICPGITRPLYATGHSESMHWLANSVASVGSDEGELFLLLLFKYVFICCHARLHSQHGACI